MLPTTFEVSQAYNILTYGIESDKSSDERALAIQFCKEILLKNIAKNLIKVAWSELDSDLHRLRISTNEVIPSPALDKIYPQEVADYIKAHIEQYFYGHKTDVHVSIDGQFVMGIECKAYTENAMLKRILVDFTLLKQVAPRLKCVLLQLESQLTGDYSQPLKPIIYGSPSSHTLLSYFDVDLHIITLLEGERKVDEPIHKEPYFKPMTEPALRKAVETLKTLLSEFVARK